MSQVVCLFYIDTDEYTYSSISLIGVFSNQEKADNALTKIIEDFKYLESREANISNYFTTLVDVDIL